MKFSSPPLQAEGTTLRATDAEAIQEKKQVP